MHSIFVIVMSMLASRFGRFTPREMPVSTLWPRERYLPCREFNSAGALYNYFFHKYNFSTGYCYEVVSYKASLTIATIS
jgi:hypothetical protein